ncbi:MAG: hypothetical protein HKN35_12575 [Woeseia sp.]|nr:hypothetical protein [Woeseia sp.]MBT8095828.1 hypothetical protein [Woeseia sp.]NNE61722.1 hypothetical protein [Woeseia sp.]NNL55082.1 hypothetical protein [Woeseia sp.]
MNVFTFLFLAVLVGACSHVIDSWIKHRHKKTEPLGDELSEALAKIDQLEDRIQVLERIVTEHPTGLKDKIEAL